MADHVDAEETRRQVIGLSPEGNKREVLGVYWTFEYTPFHLPEWAYCGPLLTPLVFVIVGSPLLIWYKLGLALRRRMACSRVKMMRQLAQCQVVMVGYWRRPDDGIKFERIMPFSRLVELSPEAARMEIRSALLRLQGNTPIDAGESIDELLRPVFTFVATRRSPLKWTGLTAS